MKRILLIAAILLSSLSLRAQDYNYAVGLRAGVISTDFEFKYNTAEYNAFKLSVDMMYDKMSGARVLGYYEFYVPVITQGMSFYYGLGGGLAFFDNPDDNQNGVNLGLAAGAIAGLEYKLADLPLAVSLDYRPRFELLNGLKLPLGDLALGIKYCF